LRLRRTLASSGEAPSGGARVALEPSLAKVTGWLASYMTIGEFALQILNVVLIRATAESDEER
jgi:hypothetical protein